jgi:hypothetical protein
MPKNDDPVDEVTADELMGLDDGSAPRPVGADLASALDDAEEERLHPILTNAEFRAAQKKAQDRVDKENRAAAMKAVEEQTVEKIRGKAGLITGDPVKDELVEIYLDLYEGADHIMLSGIRYDHGRVHKVPRHVAATLQEIAARGHNHQTELDGKGLAARPGRQGNTQISAKTLAVSVH